ncbi:hypothetical protein BH10PSE19_BH10PSE19_14770 [soil metagenome]
MKNLIFLSQRGYPRYDLATNQKNIARCVAILAEPSAAEFPTELKPFFAEIYTVPLAEATSGFFAEYILDEAAVCLAVEKEIALAGGAVNVNIVSNDEFNIVLVGKLRDRYGIPGAGEAQIDLYRNKDLMKQQLAKQAIRIPKHQLLDNTLSSSQLRDYYQDLTMTLGKSFVMKPVSGAGSVGTVIIHREDEFLTLYPTLLESAMEYEVEEYITGELFHCDSLIQNGNVIYSIASEYLFPNITYLQGKLLGSICLLPNTTLSQRIVNLNAEILQVLGPIDGVTHMELFHTPDDELVFIEIAARPGGGEIIPTYTRMLNLNFFALDMRIQAGEVVSIITPSIKEYSFGLRIPHIPGKVAEFHQPDVKSQYCFDWKIKQGDIIETSLSPIAFAGTLSMTNSNYAELYADFIKLRNFQPYSVVPV